MATRNPALGIPTELATLEDFALRDAIVRYNEQVEIIAALRKRWAQLKKPLTTEGGATGRAMVVHPLLTEIQAAELRADRFMERVLQKRKVGRPAGSTTAPDRAQPSSRIRSVK